MISDNPSSSNTNTFFFREFEAVEMVLNHKIVPNCQKNQHVSIWCVGCSSGDEPYSIAIAAKEALCNNVNIMASDIRSDMLQMAEIGLYSNWNVRQVSPARLKKWFSKTGGKYVLAEEPRKIVTFKEHDMTRDAPLVPESRQYETHPGWDVIFCRNVLVYYDKKTTIQTLTALTSVMKPDGLLLIAGLEWLSTELRNELPPSARLQLDEIDGVIVYRRRDDSMEKSPAKITPHDICFSSIGRESTANDLWRENANDELDDFEEKSGDLEILQQRDVFPGGERADKEDASLPGIQTNESEKSLDETFSVRDFGKKLLDSGQPKRALKAFESAIERESTAFDLYLYCGICHLRLRQPQRARDALRRSLFLEPKCWVAAWLLGDLLHDDAPTAAIGYFKQVKGILEVTESGSLEKQLTGHIVSDYLPGRKVALEATRARLRALKEHGIRR